MFIRNGQTVIHGEEYTRIDFIGERIGIDMLQHPALLVNFMEIPDTTKLIDFLNQNEQSVLQDWVMRMPRRMQGTLLTCVRGCDLTPKFPLDSVECRLVAALRYSFITPFDEREVDFQPGSFFSRKIPMHLKPNTLEHYPWHWLSHVIHSMEVLGYMHPSPEIQDSWITLYGRCVNSFHLNSESKSQFEERMNEDRIKKGDVVA